MGFFKLILDVFFKLILDIINKSLKVSKVLLEKSFKVRLCNKNGILIAMLVLGPFKANSTTKI